MRTNTYPYIYNVYETSPFYGNLTHAGRGVKFIILQFTAHVVYITNNHKYINNGNNNVNKHVHKASKTNYIYDCSIAFQYMDLNIEHKKAYKNGMRNIQIYVMLYYMPSNIYKNAFSFIYSFIDVNVFFFFLVSFY